MEGGIKHAIGRYIKMRCKGRSTSRHLKGYRCFPTLPSLRQKYDHFQNPYIPLSMHVFLILDNFCSVQVWSHGCGIYICPLEAASEAMDIG